MQCQEMNCPNPVQEGYAVCVHCLRAKGQGRSDPPKEPPTFHVPGERVVYETVEVVPATYEPPAIIESNPLLPDGGYLVGSIEQAKEVLVYVGLCEELELIPSGDPKATIISYVKRLNQALKEARDSFHTAAFELEELREKTEGATPIKGTPPAELEPTRVPVEDTGSRPATQASVDMLARHLAQTTIVVGGIEGYVKDIRERVALIGAHLGVKL